MLTYKFCPSARYSFFDDRKLRFSQPTALNDPHECQPLIANYSPEDFIEAVINRQMAILLAQLSAEFPGAGPDFFANRINHAKTEISKEMNKDKSRFAAIAQSIIRRKIDGIIGILSLCKNWDVKLLWSHYAEAYRGFVLGLDTESEFFKKRDNEEKDIGSLVDVTYEDKLSHVRVDKIKLPVGLFYTKQAAWAYEREQRLVRRLDHGQLTQHKDLLGMPVVLFQVPIAAIREIVVGFQAPAEVVNGAKTLRANPEGSHIELFRVRFSPTSGDLERVPL